MCHWNVIYVIVDEIIQIKLLIAINTITIVVFFTMKCAYLLWSTIFGHFSSFRCHIVNMNFRKINIGGYNKFLEMNGHNFILLLIYKLFWQTNILIIKVQFNHYMHHYIQFYKYRYTETLKLFLILRLLWLFFSHSNIRVLWGADRF